MKFCIVCNEEKENDQFFSGNTKRSKKKCKNCLKIQDNKYYEKNKEKQKTNRDKYRKEYYEKNKITINENKRKNYNPEIQKLVYQKHKEKQKISRDKYRLANKESINKQKKEYRSRPEVKEHIKRKNREYLPIKLEKLKLKRKNDQGYRLSENIKNHINRIFKTQDTNKPTKSIIGIDSEYLIKWLEFQFEDWMSWDNYGTEWQMDHIIPLSLFNKSDTLETKICFHWTNYQPLRGVENMSKKNKIVLHHKMNNIINIHRFIQKYKVDFDGYQVLNESLEWLRIHTQKGKNSIDDN
jgi:hypothetical protein